MKNSWQGQRWIWICADDGVIFDAETVITETIAEFREYHGIRVRHWRTIWTSPNFVNGVYEIEGEHKFTLSWFPTCKDCLQVPLVKFP